MTVAFGIRDETDGLFRSSLWLLGGWNGPLMAVLNVLGYEVMKFFPNLQISDIGLQYRI